MIFQKILVPLDGSEHSERALEAAVQLAKKLDSKLALFTVYSVTGLATPCPGSSIMTLQHVRDSCNTILAEAEQKVKSEAVEVETLPLLSNYSRNQFATNLRNNWRSKKLKTTKKRGMLFVSWEF